VCTAAYYQENKERIGKLQKKYYQENKESHNAWCKEYRSTRKEWYRELSNSWRAKNIDKVRARKNARYAANREYYRAQRKRWVAENFEHVAARRKKYSQSKRGRYLSYKFSAAHRSRPCAFELTYEQFVEFWQKPCTYCNTDIETIGLDRMDSAKGYILENVTPCCRACNEKKNNTPYDRWMDFIEVRNTAPPDTKVCTRCLQAQPRENFYKNKVRKDNLSSRCSACARAIQESYKENNSEDG
tara:strand:- start:522 stop:1250 length:729 start_codon:yes stop_codon:yes gene_type:complete